MSSEKLLTPLPKPPGKRPIKEWYYDRLIKQKLDSDEDKQGHITQANYHNRHNCRLLSLPAELRNVIWEFAITPCLILTMYHTDYGPRPEPERTCSVNIFSRKASVFPDKGIVLASRDIYQESRQIYAAAVARFYEDTPLHLMSSGFLDEVCSRPNEIFSGRALSRRNMNLLNDVNLQKIPDFMVYDSTRDSRPQLMFKDGVWRGRWRSWGAPDPDGIVVHHIVLYKKAGRSIMKKVMKRHGGVRYDLLENGKRCGAYYTYDNPIEALLIPEKSSPKALEALRAAAGSQRITREVIAAMIYIQAFTSGRYA